MIYAVASFIISALLTRRFCDPASWLYILDLPNERSLHSRPIPRGGGMAILLSILVIWLVRAVVETTGIEMIWIGTGALVVSAVSFWDDRVSLNPALRLIVHVGVAGMLVYAGFYLWVLELPGVVLNWPEKVGAFISLFFIVWMINLYNFMDGMDGFAAGMAVSGFGFLGMAGWLAGDSQFAHVNWIIAGSAAGFLLFNFPPAKIFMGDVGSSLLGFLAAAMSLMGVRRNIFFIWTPILVFSPFIVDATFTLARRFWRGERIWQAHKSHYYQRLVQLGWGHKKAVVWEYALMVACGCSALCTVYFSPITGWLMLGLWALIYGFFIYWISRLERKDIFRGS